MQEKAEIVISDSTEDIVDGFFETPDTAVTTVTADVDGGVDIESEATRLWTLSDAAANLGLSTRTILRRLKTGSLKGIKVQGANGPEWRISPMTPRTADAGNLHASVTTVTPDRRSSDDTTVATLVKVIAEQSEQLKLQAEHLQAATYLIQNQQSHILEQSQQIKLLEDRSRHYGWWHSLLRRLFKG